MCSRDNDDDDENWLHEIVWKPLTHLMEKSKSKRKNHRKNCPEIWNVKKTKLDSIALCCAQVIHEKTKKYKLTKTYANANLTRLVVSRASAMSWGQRRKPENEEETKEVEKVFSPRFLHALVGSNLETFQHLSHFYVVQLLHLISPAFAFRSLVYSPSLDSLSRSLIFTVFFFFNTCSGWTWTCIEHATNDVNGRETKKRTQPARVSRRIV